MGAVLYRREFVSGVFSGQVKEGQQERDCEERTYILGLFFPRPSGDDMLLSNNYLSNMIIFVSTRLGLTSFLLAFFFLSTSNHSYERKDDIHNRGDEQ